MNRIRLSQEVPVYMRICSEDTELRREARRYLGGATSAEELWAVLESNNRYADVVNFSSRPVGNEEVVYAALMLAPPEVSQHLLQRYEQQGYLEQEDVEDAY
jgi:hypothetical protein